MCSTVRAGPKGKALSWQFYPLYEKCSAVPTPEKSAQNSIIWDGEEGRARAGVYYEERSGDKPLINVCIMQLGETVVVIPQLTSAILLTHLQK